MSDSQIEKHIRDKVDRHISPIDADALWNDIQKKQKKSVPYWRLGILSALLLLSTIIGFYFSRFNNESFNIIISETKLPIEQNTNNSKPVQKFKNVEQHQTEINDTIINTPNNNIDGKSDDANLRNSIIPSSKKNAPKSSLKEETTQIKPKLSEIKMLAKKQSGSKISLQSTDLAVIRIVNEQVQNKKTLSPIDTGIANDIKDKEGKNRPDNTNLLENKQFPITEKETLTNRSKTIDLLSIRTNILSEDVEQLSLSNPNLPQLPITKKKKLFDLGAYFNYEYAFKNFEPNTKDTIFFANDSLAQAYVKARNYSESFIESFRTGIFLRKHFKPGFRIISGIEYAQLTERFDAKINLGRFTVFDSLNIPNYSIVERTHHKKIYNRYTSINLPVLIGKKIERQACWFWFDIGVAINLRFHRTGQIFENWNMEEVMHLSTQEPAIFKKQLGISYVANLGIGYSLSNDFSIEFGPHFQSTFSSINQNYGLDTKYYYVGVQLKLTKEF